MLKVKSVNQRDGVEQQSGLQEKADFKNEIRELELLIANLTSPRTSPGKKNGQKNNRKRLFGFQQISLRRAGKKKSSSANAGETREDFTERVHTLQGICKDLTRRLREDELNNGTTISAEKNPNMDESRDDDEISSFRRRIDEEERTREEDRNELMIAIAACEKILSKFSSNVEIKSTESTIDRDDSKQSNENAIEKTESKLNAIEITESKFLENCANEEDEEPKNSVKEEAGPIEQILSTESESAENATSFMCCGANLMIVEMIENLVRYLVGDGNQEEKEEEKEEALQEEEREEGSEEEVASRGEEDDIEEKATQHCFCAVSELWNTEDNQDASSEEDIPQIENEVSVDAVTNTVKTEFLTNSKEQEKYSSSSAEEPKIETENPKVENQSRGDSDDDSEDSDDDSEDSSPQKENEVTSSLDCDLFNSLCYLQRKDTETDSATPSEPTGEKSGEEEATKSLNCDKLDSPRSLKGKNNNSSPTNGKQKKDDEVLDYALFNSLCSLESTNTDTFDKESKNPNTVDEKSSKEELDTSCDCEPMLTDTICALDDADSFTEEAKDQNSVTDEKKNPGKEEVERSLDQSKNPNTVDVKSQKEELDTSCDCGPMLMDTICALDDADSFTEEAKDQNSVTDEKKNPGKEEVERSLDHQLSSPTLEYGKSMDTEFLSVGASTFADYKTIGASTFADYKTIDQGIFTSLDSIVGAKYRDEPVENEQMLDTIDAASYVKGAVVGAGAGAMAFAVAKMYDLQVCAVPSADLQDSGDERVIKTVSTMDFIPRIEVVGVKTEVVGVKKEKKTPGIKKIIGFKKSNNNANDERKSNNRANDDKKKKTSTAKKTNPTNSRNKEAPRLTKEQRHIKNMKSISFMDCVPNQEVVGAEKKQPRKRNTSPKKERETKEKKPVSKKTSISNKAETPTRKMSQRDYRRMAAKKRREQRKRKNLPKGGKKPLGTVQEAPEHMKQPNNDSANSKEMIEKRSNIKKRSNTIQRETPETLGQKSFDEMSAPLEGLVDFLLPPVSPQNSKPQNGRKKALSPRSRASGYHQKLLRENDPLNAATPSLTGFDYDDGSDYDDYHDGHKKKSRFFPRKKKGKHADIVESLSPVLSIPEVGTHGTRYGDDDDEYVKRYYNFSDDGEYGGESTEEERDDDEFVSHVRSNELSIMRSY